MQEWVVRLTVFISTLGILFASLIPDIWGINIGAGLLNNVKTKTAKSNRQTFQVTTSKRQIIKVKHNVFGKWV